MSNEYEIRDGRAMRKSPRAITYCFTDTLEEARKAIIDSYGEGVIYKNGKYVEYIITYDEFMRQAYYGIQPSARR